MSLQSLLARFNLVQVGGTAVDTNSGNKSAGTQRVVLATDQPALTNALKVDGSAVTQPVSGTFWQATQPVSLASGATAIAKAEDVASADADVGVPAMAIRKATPANTSGTDGDYEMLQMAAGRLWVDASGKTLTVDGSGVTQPVSGTVTVQQATATNLKVDLSGTAANSTALKVDGSAVTQPVSLAGTATATLTNVASSATSVTLLSSNTSRKGATIYNDSTQVLYVKFGTTASSTSHTIQMAAGSYYEVPFNYNGRIDGIWASANGNARVTEIT